MNISWDLLIVGVGILGWVSVAAFGYSRRKNEQHLVRKREE